MNVKIVADSTCDLSKEICDKYDISILPLHILLGEKEYKDGIDIHKEEIFSWVDKHDETPKTSAPSLKDALDIFKSLKDDYDEFVCFSISSSMSSSFQVMKVASEELEMEDCFYCIDSKNLSNGIGLLVLEAAELAREGKSGKEIQEIIETIIPKVKTSFVLDTMEYLHKGGRCSSLSAIMSGPLKIHPKIVVNDGEMKVDKIYRGLMSKVANHYLKDQEEDLMASDPKRICLIFAGVDEAIKKDMMEYIKSLQHFNEILCFEAGGVVCSHCGPGCFGVMYRN